MKFSNDEHGRVIAGCAIIIGIVLILVLIGFFRSSQHPFSLPNYHDTIKLPCGLTLYHPKGGELMTFPYTVTGYANGCGWIVHDGQIGHALVLSNTGIILSDTIIAAGPETSLPVSFEADINAFIPRGMTAGQIVVTNGLDAEYARNLVIPVQF